MKTCPRCKITKPASEFGKHHKYKTGLNPRCLECCREVRNAYYKAHPQKAIEASRAWRKQNSERYSAYLKRWNAGRKDYRRNYHFKKLYGITLDGYAEMLQSQNGKCACCGTDNPGGKGNRFVVDHCHLSNKVRGLICHRCNFALGNLNDSVQTALNAASYLLRLGGIESYADSQIFLSDETKSALDALAQNGWKRPQEVAA